MARTRWPTEESRSSSSSRNVVKKLPLRLPSATAAATACSSACSSASQGRSARKTAAEAAKIAEKARETDELRRAIGDKLYARRSFAERLIATKALRLHSYGLDAHRR